MLRIRLCLALGFLGLLSACVAQLPWASEDKLRQAVYSHGGPPSVTLMTVMSSNGRSAGHSSLLINGSQRVIYDPAGTWFNRAVPERADLLYGITPKMLQYYLDYHARQGFQVVMQTKFLSATDADKLIRDSIANGSSVSGMCASNTSKLLSMTAGFEGFPIGLFPKDAVKAFASVAGVKTRRIIQDDVGKDLK